MRDIDITRTCEILNQIMECELAGVIRIHYSLMVMDHIESPSLIS